MSDSQPSSSRHPCPCCGYPTLGELAANEICELCNWEDDGQDDETADEVWGGPNSDYSLTEARGNFRKYRVMYAPGRDQRLTQGDSTLEFETKGQLMAMLEQLSSAGPAERSRVMEEVARLEAVLQAETERRIRAYEAAHRGDA